MGKEENIIITHEEWRNMKLYYGMNNKKVFKIEKNTNQNEVKKNENI